MGDRLDCSARTRRATHTDGHECDQYFIFICILGVDWTLTFNLDMDHEQCVPIRTILTGSTAVMSIMNHFPGGLHGEIIGAMAPREPSIVLVANPRYIVCIIVGNRDLV